jgi:UDP-N-acetyl-2-amino-2-deoxyglucuronate dehydrogenase
MMPQHSLALIGLGMGATPHAQSLLDLQHRVVVAAACTRSPERAAVFATRFAFPIEHDLAVIERDANIDCVLIATPPNSHLELVQRFARAGKHILLEKPLEVSVEKAEALVRVCDEAKVKLAVVFQHRFRPGALALKQILNRGRLGKLAVSNVSVPWWRPQSYYDVLGRGTLARDGGGVLMTQAIHQLDLFLDLTGGVTEVMAYTDTTPVHRMETEDAVAAALRFRHGGIGALAATTTSYPGFGESMELTGTNGTAHLVDGRMSAHFYDGTSETAGETGGGGGGADPMAFSNDAHRAVLAEFLDAIDADREPVNSGLAALNVHYLIDALLASARDRAPVAVKGA